MTSLLLALAFQTGIAADSARTVQAAARAQADFERGRIWLLDPTPPGAAGSCDVRIGRYCYWYNENEPPPPEDTEALLLGRGVLLDQLNAALARYPGDAWLTGQLVRYLIEDQRTDSALGVATSCRTTPWWCAALEGLVYHVSGVTGRAERAFGVALREMPEATRCQWNNLEPLLTGHFAGAYKELDCPGRDSANARLLWLGRPQFSAPGNPLATEIWARRTWLASYDNAITHDGTPMGADLTELVFRYGWSTHWSQNRPPVGRQGGYTLVGHEPKPAYSFFPDHVDEATGTPVWKWKDPAARSRFHPRWATAIVWIDDLQWARFLRGDQAMVVAAFQAPWDTIRTARFTDVTLALSAGPEEGDPIPGFGTSDGPRGVARATGRRGVPLLSSLEVIDPGSGAAAIGRGVLQPLDEGSGREPVISDILLFNPGTDVVEGIDDAVRLARPGTRIPRGSAVGLYWEVYRPGEGAWSVALSVEEERAGFLTRVGRTFGLGAKPRPIKLAWSGAAGEGVVAQSIEVDLADLPPGRYSVLVTLSRGEEAPLQSARSIEIVAR